MWCDLYVCKVRILYLCVNTLIVRSWSSMLTLVLHVCVMYLYYVCVCVCCFFVRYVYMCVWLPWLHVRGLSCWHWCCGASRRAWWCWRGAGRSCPETRRSPPHQHPHCPTNLWPTKTVITLHSFHRILTKCIDCKVNLQTFSWTPESLFERSFLVPSDT